MNRRAVNGTVLQNGVCMEVIYIHMSIIMRHGSQCVHQFQSSCKPRKRNSKLMNNYLRSTMISSIKKEELLHLIKDDSSFVRLANEARESLGGYPAQSKFRVLAIFVVEKPDGSFCLVKGANAEQGYIGGAICAERAALCSLRFLEVGCVIQHVVVVTDSHHPTSCGALCREFLMSHAKQNIPVVFGNAEGNLVARCSLGDLWPQPYIYRFNDNSSVVEAGRSMALRLQSIKDRGIQNLYEKARGVNALDSLDALHPIRFSAAVLFEDGSIESAWQLKGLEYGCTLDPVSQLIHDMERRKYCSPCATSAGDAVDPHQAGLATKPVMLVMCDQFGVAHAPFAQARSLLNEHGYRYVIILVHDEEGRLNSFPVHELLPNPEGTYFVSHDDFVC